MVLDAGAGSKPYRHHFSHLIYESADLPGSGDQTYECDLHSIPVSSERYDFVTCNKALEHVKKPFRVMKELKRVCKPGGYIFYSIPFYYVEHMIPYDYYRCTSYGSRFLAGRVGFEIVEFGLLDSFVSTVSFQLAQIKKICLHLTRSFNRECAIQSSLKNTLLLLIVFRKFQVIFLLWKCSLSKEDFLSPRQVTPELLCSR